MENKEGVICPSDGYTICHRGLCLFELRCMENHIDLDDDEIESLMEDNDGYFISHVLNSEFGE